MLIELKIYEILTKKRYNRNEPYLRNKIIEEIQYFVSQNKPIQLVWFWGVGQKEKPNRADLTSCKFLTELNEEIKKIYSPGIEFVFIFATLHGIHNWINRRNIDNYFKEMEKIFKNLWFSYVYLDNLWGKYDINFGKINIILKNKQKDWWNEIENNTTIERNAEKRNKMLISKIAAQKYYIMRDLEKKMLEKEFPKSIFHAFSDAKLKNLLPNLPTLYLYSIKKYRSDAPWFVIDDK